jgi:hypothetical protein
LVCIFFSIAILEVCHGSRRWLMVIRLLVITCKPSRADTGLGRSLVARWVCKVFVAILVYMYDNSPWPRRQRPRSPIHRVRWLRVVGRVRNWDELETCGNFYLG